MPYVVVLVLVVMVGTALFCHWRKKPQEAVQPVVQEVSSSANVNSKGASEPKRKEEVGGQESRVLMVTVASKGQREDELRRKIAEIEEMGR